MTQWCQLTPLGWQHTACSPHTVLLTAGHVASKGVTPCVTDRCCVVMPRAGGIGAPRTAGNCQAAALKLDFAVEEAQKLQVGVRVGRRGGPGGGSPCWVLVVKGGAVGQRRFTA